jgi:DDE superfamily endonuclease
MVAVRAIIVATIQKDKPELFNQTFRDGSTFSVSDSYCRKFLHGTMQWSERKATKAAQKLPNDWEDVCERAFLRRANIIKEEDIPVYLVVNSDQTGVVYGPGSKLTWAPRGSKQVSLIGADEKRAFTALLSISANGFVLPIQAVFEGLTEKSCPSPAAPHYADCIKAGFRFVPSEKKGNHWSNQRTMRRFVDEILAPYLDAQKTHIGRPQSQKSLWIIDVWAVHRSDEFISWMRDNHPTILIDFVPGGCTGISQPLDIGINRPFKQSIKVSYHADLVDDFLGQMKENRALEFDTHIGPLRDASVGWIWNAYQVIQREELVKKVWFRHTQLHLLTFGSCRHLQGVRFAPGTCHTSASLPTRPENDCGRRKTKIHPFGTNFKRSP